MEATMTENHALLIIQLLLYEIEKENEKNENLYVCVCVLAREENVNFPPIRMTNSDGRRLAKRIYTLYIYLRWNKTEQKKRSNND